MRRTLAISAMVLVCAIAGSRAQADTVDTAYSLTVYGDGDTPVFSLQNTSSDLKITGIEITIGSPNHEFDLSWTLWSSPSIQAVLLRPDDKQGDVTSDAVEYLFDGFIPGAMFIFETDIDPLVSGASIDYRTILFNNGSAPNAYITVEFENGLSLEQIMPNAPASAHRFILDQSYTTVAPLPSAAMGGAALIGALGAVRWVRRRR